jgi:hypothetical protein
MEKSGYKDSLAATDFEPVEDLDGAKRALSGPRWRQTADTLGEDLRIAALFLEKTKAEVIEGSRKLGEDALLEVIDSLHQAKELFKSYAALAGAAEGRLLVAASGLAGEKRP